MSQTNACTTAHTTDPYARGIRVRHCLSHSGHRAIAAAVHYNDRSMAGAPQVHEQSRKMQHVVSVNIGAYVCEQAIKASHDLAQQFKATSQQAEFPTPSRAEKIHGSKSDLPTLEPAVNDPYHFKLFRSSPRGSHPRERKKLHTPSIA